MFKKFLRDEQGQDVIEWGLLAGFLGVAILVGIDLSGIGPTIAGWYQDVVDTINP